MGARERSSKLSTKGESTAPPCTTDPLPLLRSTSRGREIERRGVSAVGVRSGRGCGQGAIGARLARSPALRVVLVGLGEDGDDPLRE